VRRLIAGVRMAVYYGVVKQKDLRTVHETSTFVKQ
jgi:hypothetical protein